MSCVVLIWSDLSVFSKIWHWSDRNNYSFQSKHHLFPRVALSDSSSLCGVIFKSSSTAHNSISAALIRETQPRCCQTLTNVSSKSNRLKMLQRFSPKSHNVDLKQPEKLYASWLNVDSHHSVFYLGFSWLEVLTFISLLCLICSIGWSKK